MVVLISKEVVLGDLDRVKIIINQANKHLFIIPNEIKQFLRWVIRSIISLNNWVQRSIIEFNVQSDFCICCIHEYNYWTLNSIILMFGDEIFPFWRVLWIKYRLCIGAFFISFFYWLAMDEDDFKLAACAALIIAVVMKNK